MDYEICDLGCVILQNGATLRDCKLAHKTFGMLNAANSATLRAIAPGFWSSAFLSINVRLTRQDSLGIRLDNAVRFKSP